MKIRIKWFCKRGVWWLDRSIEYLRLERTFGLKILKVTEANLSGQLNIHFFLLLEKYTDVDLVLFVFLHDLCLTLALIVYF